MPLLTVKNPGKLAPPVDSVIHDVRGQRVILDADLARIYGVQTFRFNEAVKRNQTRFPEDFRFQLSKEEAEALTSQTAIPKTPSGRGGRRTLLRLNVGFWSLRSEASFGRKACLSRFPACHLYGNT